MWNFCQEIAQALQEGKKLALVSLIASKGSAPRTSGARMLVFEDGRISGTVGGGRSEAEAIEAALHWLRLPEDARSCREGFAADQEFAAALPGRAVTSQAWVLSFSLSKTRDMDMICGGDMTLLLELPGPGAQELYFEAAASFVGGSDACFLSALSFSEYELAAFVQTSWHEASAGLVRRVLLSEPEAAGALCSPTGGKLALPEELRSSCREAMKQGQATLLRAAAGMYLLEALQSPSRVFIFGAGHVSKALAGLTGLTGFSTEVLDDRPEFASQERFPGCAVHSLASLNEEYVAEWMRGRDIGGRDAIVIVTRGHAHDRDVLAAALAGKAGYIGMIGSKTKRRQVYESLQSAGFSAEDLARVASPIGLPIGAETPEEIAVSIAAELIQWKRQGSGGF